MWKTIEYAVPGKSHIKSGTPCQDKVRSYHKGKTTVIALADGAGSAKLSHYGAEAVIERITEELGEHFDDYYREEDASLIRSRLLFVILDALESVQNRLKCDLRDLSSTLLTVAVSGSRFFLVHIGDGVIGYLKDGVIKVATRPDNGEFTNNTVFTTSPVVISHMRIIKGNDDMIGGFVLMSDGTESSLYNKQTGELSQGIKRIMQMTVLCSRESMYSLLKDTFFTSVMHYTQDDCSISILADTNAFLKYSEMTKSEKQTLLQMTVSSRYRDRRIWQTEKIMIAAARGATVDQIARYIHVKPKYVQGKLSSLIRLGLLETNQGIYYSVLDDSLTNPK